MLRSDEMRKELCGVRMSDRLGVEGYTAGVSDRVYGAITASAALIVRNGHSVIVDAVHGRLGDRDAIERVAIDAGVPFAGFWLEAPETALIARVQARRDDPLDADVRVVRPQHAQQTGPVQWRCIDASLPSEAVRRSVGQALETHVTRSCAET